MRWAGGVLVIVGLGCGRAGFDPIRTVPVDGDAVATDGLAGEAGPIADADLATACPSAYQPVAGLTSRYRRGDADTTWHAAEQNCEADGGHLAVIDNDAENSWLESQASGWIGLSDHRIEGDFVHVTGPRPGYTNWSSDEPNNGQGGEDCAAFYFGVQWNDYACDTVRPYMCECDAVPLPSPAVWCVTGLDSSCGTCDDVCPGGTSCAPSQTCVPI